jgi:hypothetical protein
MTTWKQAAREGVVSGSIASVLSTAYLAWAGRQRGTSAAPVNAPSHWIFGDRALRQQATSKRYTLTGFLIHHGASLFWGVLHAKAWGARPEHKKPVPAVAGAAAAAAIACVVDYRLTPDRLTPGFEHHLSRPEMTKVYGLFALGLLAGTLLMRERNRRTREARAEAAASSAD